MPDEPLQREQLPFDPDGNDVVDAVLVDDAGPAELTVADAAAAVGVHRRTIMRKLDAGLLPGAYKDGPTGSWRIPWPALLAAGYDLTTPADKVPTSSTPALTADADLLDELRAQVAALQVRAQVAQAVADERLRTITVQESALRDLRAMLPAVTPAPAPESTTPARRWWLRKG